MPQCTISNAICCFCCTTSPGCCGSTRTSGPAPHGMTRAQWAILIWLERQPGISQKELAELLEVEPITVARLIDRLEARGMVERRPDPKRPAHLAPASVAARASGPAGNRRSNAPKCAHPGHRRHR